MFEDDEFLFSGDSDVLALTEYNRTLLSLPAAEPDARVFWDEYCHLLAVPESARTPDQTQRIRELHDGLLPLLVDLEVPRVAILTPDEASTLPWMARYAELWTCDDPCRCHQFKMYKIWPDGRREMWTGIFYKAPDDVQREEMLQEVLDQCIARKAAGIIPPYWHSVATGAC